MTIALSLSDLKTNERGRIRLCRAGGLMKQKLISMGLIPGVEVTVLRSAPLLDPIEIAVQNYQVALRRSEALLVEVDKI